MTRFSFPGAVVVLVAGGTQDAVGIPAVEAKLREPFGTAFDRAGNLWIIEMESGNRLLKVDRSGVLTHFAGQPKAGFSGNGGPALEAQFKGPHNLAILPSGNVLIADTFNGHLREVDVQAAIVNESPLQKPASSKPFCVALAFDGSQVYVADLLRVYSLDLKSGAAKVIAGNGSKGAPPDGSVAANAPLLDPRAVAPDHHGNVYILERNGNALLVVDPQGVIRTVVNATGARGAAGDGGPALAATMNGPKHLCVDLDDSVIIADAENNIVRRYQPKDGKITRIAGTGKKGAGGLGGDPLKCELARPHGVTVNPETGELYITDSYNDRILKIVKE